MERPLAIDLFTGLHGWAEGLIAEGWRVLGVDIVDMSAEVGEPKPEHFELILEDVLNIHGSRFKDAHLIVSSSPCQKYSYMAMPWQRAKALAASIRADETGDKLRALNALYDAQFRIQREASEAAGRYIPMICENVRGAQDWVGRAAWNFGSYYLWGDVPALMPQTLKATKVPGFRFDGSGKSFQTASVEAHVEEGRKHHGDWFRDPAAPSRQGGQKGREHDLNADGSGPAEGVKVASEAGRRTAPGLGARFTSRDCGVEAEGRKGPRGAWFNDDKTAVNRLSVSGSKSPARKAASAKIAKIPFALSSHIARIYRPKDV